MNPQSTFRALSDPTRREILHMLAGHDLTIAQVSDRFEMTRAAVKKHLTVLNEGGLISVETRGRERINSLNPQGFAPVRDWLAFFETYWDDHLGALKRTIEKKENS